MNYGKNMNNPNLIPENILKVVIDSFNIEQKTIKKTIPHRIKINGNFITTMSGKTIWKTLGHAKSALNHHISNIIGYKRFMSYEDYKILQNLAGKERTPKYVMEYMVSKGIVEFVPFNDNDKMTLSDIYE